MTGLRATLGRMVADGHEDEMDHRPRSLVDTLGHRRVLLGVLIVTLAVALGFLAGRAAGSGAPAKTAVRQVTTTQTVTSQVTAAPPTPSSGPFNQVIGTGNRCSMQKGNQLQLGVEVQNELDVPITLIGVHVPYATGDELRPIGSTRGACGQLPGADNSITGYPSL